MVNKKDNVCFDISSLNDDQKRTFAKELKKSVDKFNAEVNVDESKEEKH